MRHVGRFLAGAFALVTFAGTAAAQPAKPDGDNSQFSLKRPQETNYDAETARTKANAGDCAGALSAFDAAIERAPNDPTLHRDRGLCHEKLGNTYPALEDLRIYVTARPGAPDADQIRQKVNALEKRTDNDDKLLESNDRRDTTAATEDSLDVYQKEDASGRHKETGFGAKPGEQEKSYEYYKKQEELNDRAERSSVRNGHGTVIGVWAQFPRAYFFGHHQGGIGFAAGGAVKYAFSKMWTGLFDFGWQGQGAFRSVTNEPLYQTFDNGPVLALALEGRIAFDPRANNQFIFRLGAGYERLVNSDSKAYANFVDGRFALGIRHVFGESFGMAFMVDGGPAVGFPETGSAVGGGVVGFAFGLDFGL